MIALLSLWGGVLALLVIKYIVVLSALPEPFRAFFLWSLLGSIWMSLGGFIIRWWSR